MAVAPSPRDTSEPIGSLAQVSFGSLVTTYTQSLPAVDNASDPRPAVVFVHGFGACKEHWRHTIPPLARERACYALDLIGFGASSKPVSVLNGEPASPGSVRYCVDLWAEQVERFVLEVVQQPVHLVGNSIGGVVALAAAQRLELAGQPARQVILVDCAQRSIDEKRLAEQPPLRRLGRPLLKSLVRQRWLTDPLFRSLAKAGVIRRVLEIAYPTRQGVDDALVGYLLAPTRDSGASESFRGFINLFDDRLAPDLLQELRTPVRMIWGARDPWEPLAEAQRWAEAYSSVVKELVVLEGLGHCPHDEAPERVNPVLEQWLAMAD